MSRFFGNTWRRLTIAHVKLPRDANDWFGTLLFATFQIQIVAIASGIFPLADLFGSFFALLYCAIMELTALWNVPIDEAHYYKAVAALQDASSVGSNDPDDLG